MKHNLNEKKKDDNGIMGLLTGGFLTSKMW
jgi:hypothetical protein